MNTPTVIHLEVPAEIACLGIITACLNELILAQPGLVEPELVSHNLQLAVHETCINVIEHAYADQLGGRLALTMIIEPQPDAPGSRLIVEIDDTSVSSFDPAAVAVLDLDEPQEGGYGLFLVQQLMDEVVYETRPDGHRWRLVKNLEQ
jgi:serine/threonine-protein kinase RsbW